MRFNRLPETRARSGLSGSSIYEQIKQDNFPSPVKLSDRCSAWIDLELESWQAWRIAKRDGLCPENVTWRQWHEARKAEMEAA